MKNGLWKNVKLQILLGTIVVVLCLMVWPLRFFYHASFSGYQEAEPSYTGAVTMEEIVLQQFIPAEKHVQTLSMECEVEDVHSQDRVFVTLYNADFEMVYQEVLFFTKISAIGDIRIEPDMEFVPGDIYYIGLNVHFDSIGTLKIAYADQSVLQIEETGSFAYANVQYPGQSALMKFYYTSPFSTGLTVCCIVGILLGGSFAYIGILCLYGVLKKHRILRKFEIIRLRAAFSIMILADVVCFYYLCIAKIFGRLAWDIAAYAAACVILLVILLYGWYREEARMRRKRNKRKKGKKTGQPVQLLHAKKVWLNYLQIVCFVFVIWAGVEYVDASVQWKQDLARNWFYLLFAAAVLLTFRLRQVLNPCTVILGLVMIPAGMVYCHIQGTDANELAAARIMVVAFTLWCVVLIHTLRNLGKLREQRINIPLALCWGLMCICMIVNRAGKEWPIFMTVSFTLLYLQNYSDTQKKQITHNLITAILAQFIFMVVMCLLHRPYHYYQFNRYPMWFHTVASTGIYLAMVEAAALLRLFLKMRDTKSVVKKVWKEWLLNGLVLSYISLTVARTAILSVIGLCLILAIGAMIVYRPGGKQYLRVLGALLASLALSVPVVYTATRCIPAVVNDPVYLYDTEDFDYAIREGEALDSDKYMNFKALIRLWAKRLWVPETFIQTYLEDQASEIQGLSVLAEWASAEDAGSLAAQESHFESANDMSNGRLQIFAEYLKRLNFRGHAVMELKTENGVSASHAHNSYIQNAYDFGILAGVLFLLLTFGMAVRSVYLIWVGKDRSEMQFAVLLMSGAFILASLTEYVSNPCMPLCFAMLFLLFTMRNEKNVVN